MKIIKYVLILILINCKLFGFGLPEPYNCGSYAQLKFGPAIYFENTKPFSDLYKNLSFNNNFSSVNYMMNLELEGGALNIFSINFNFSWPQSLNANQDIGYSTSYQYDLISFAIGCPIYFNEIILLKPFIGCSFEYVELDIWKNNKVIVDINDFYKSNARYGIFKSDGVTSYFIGMSIDYRFLKSEPKNTYTMSTVNSFFFEASFLYYLGGHQKRWGYNEIEINGLPNVSLRGFLIKCNFGLDIVTLDERSFLEKFKF
ncbi:MAG: hypothetical protein HW421_1730 [Ignavibacteria bacterium]|nr:hypothetical protein [Ignavibacteria bacterium]